jgi:hypothetical protein
MAAGENEQEHILALESGELMLLWQLHRPDMGNAVEITSGAHTPACTLLLEVHAPWGYCLLQRVRVARI